MQQLDSYIITTSILPFLTYDDAIQLSFTNKRMNECYQIARKNMFILPISTNMIFLERGIDDDFDDPDIYCKIIDYSHLKKIIQYRYMPYGTDGNIRYPILNQKIYFMSRTIISPTTTQIQELPYDLFMILFEKSIDNSYYVYSMYYLHPTLYSILSQVFVYSFLVFLLGMCYLSLIIICIIFQGPHLYFNYKHLQIGHGICLNNDNPVQMLMNLFLYNQTEQEVYFMSDR